MTNLRALYLRSNELISIDRLVFVGLIQLDEVYLGSNPISNLFPSLVLKLCSTNPNGEIYLF